ncbi:MAG: D-glycero-beta-D-manno-heptose-7-phosphate kinase [Nitrospinae bacterium]|nr:D-glycero-beta-D-manno-heptose-7-phosphate kinase [Nitrospinota bacterium]
MNQRLYEALASMRPPRVMVVGDVILDIYVRGVIERISPEAPAQVLEITGEEILLGGAANVAANAAALGADARLVGLVGKDSAAQALRGLLKKRKIPSESLVIDQTRPTTTKTRFMAMRQQMLRVDRERRHTAPPDAMEKMLARIRANIGKCDGLIISDYGKGALPDKFLEKLIALARASGKMVVVDPKGRDYSKYRGATIITPNRKEASLASGVDIKDEDDYRQAAERLFEITKAQHILITRGEEGMTVFHRRGRGVHLPAEALEVFDVSGAGDTVIAALAVMLFAGHTLEDAAKVANVAAAIEVGHVGAKAVAKDEVLRRLSPEPTGSLKAMTRKEAAAFAKRARGEGRTVVFTNGCFDIIHAGHVDYLFKARAAGDVLILGLNTDSSVRKLKGKNRPLMNENDRLKVLSALSCVDAVTLFNEDTPLNLIKAVQPDIVVKGGDYTPDTVVGRDVVEKRGGKVVIVPLMEGRSTTGIINHIVGKYKKDS